MTCSPDPVLPQQSSRENGFILRDGRGRPFACHPCRKIVGSLQVLVWWFECRDRGGVFGRGDRCCWQRQKLPLLPARRESSINSSGCVGTPLRVTMRIRAAGLGQAQGE